MQAETLRKELLELLLLLEEEDGTLGAEGVEEEGAGYKAGWAPGLV